ncbi:MAG: hypothetical protein ABI881_07365 [Betaproteobacteria bacterium]
MTAGGLRGNGVEIETALVAVRVAKAVTNNAGKRPLFELMREGIGVDNGAIVS